MLHSLWVIEYQGAVIDHWFQDCSTQHYSGVDFSSFFVWGDQTVTTMATPACTAPCTAADVVAGSTVTCTTVKIRDKMNSCVWPFLDFEIYLWLQPQQDTTAQTLAWNVPIGNCGMTTSEVPASGTQGQAGYTPAQVHHVIYLNPSANSAHVMHQVKLTCKHNIYIDERIVLKIIHYIKVECRD